MVIGYNDDVDVFPDDVNEQIDSDNDGVGDNSDGFPNNNNNLTDKIVLNDNQSITLEIKNPEEIIRYKYEEFLNNDNITIQINEEN